MRAYAYKGRLPDGRMEKGTIRARSPQEAQRKLRARGITPKSVSPAFLHVERRPSLRDLSAFSAQLASMINANVPLPQSLAAIAPQFNGPLRDAIYNIAAQTEEGADLAMAMSKHEDVFGTFLIGLVAAGQETGSLADTLRHASLYLKKQHLVAARIKRALTYPVFSLFVAIVVAYGLMVGIVPQFAEMLTGVGGELPLITKVLLSASTFLQDKGLYLGIALMAGYFAFARWKNGPGKAAYDRFVLRVPAFGPIVRLQILTQITRLWPLLHETKALHIQILPKIAESVANTHYSNALNEIAKQVRNGTPLQDAFARYPNLFPSNLLAYIKVGADSANLSHTLIEAADFFEAELDDRIDALQAILEPVMMVIIGGIVFTIVLGVLLPFMKIAAALG